MYYKLGQACVTNWGNFVLLQIMVGVITIEAASLLQIDAPIINQGNRYYKIGKLLQIGAKFITNWGKYY